MRFILILVRERERERGKREGDKKYIYSYYVLRCKDGLVLIKQNSRTTHFPAPNKRLSTSVY